MKGADSSKASHPTFSSGGRAGNPQAAKRSTACTATHAISSQGIVRRAGHSPSSCRYTRACPNAASAIEGFGGDSWRYHSVGSKGTDGRILSGTAISRDDS
eukprot:891485-Pleurochrysis_carterae.AAC.1